MRVLHVSNYYPGLHNHAGGAEQAMQWTMRLHAEAGVENLLLTTPAEREPDAPLDDVCQARFEAPTVESMLSPRARQLLEPAKWYAVQLDPLASARLVQVALTQRVAAVHFGNAQFVTLGALPLLRAAGIRTVLSVYDYWLFCPLTTLIRREEAICRQAQGTGCLSCLPREHLMAQRALLSVRPAVMRAIAASIDRFVVLSESSRRIAEAHGVKSSRIRVIRLPREQAGAADAGARRRGEAFDGADVVLVGWQQWRKGIHVALEAWPAVRARFAAARLHLVGGPVKFGEAYERRLDEIIARHDIAGSVVRHGRVSDGELERLVGEAAVVLIPEQWENMSPLMLLRAMEQRKAIVASRIGGIPEFARDGHEALLADARRPEDFAAAVIRLLEDRELAAQLGAAAQQRVAALCSPDSSREAWRALYRELLPRAWSRSGRPRSGRPQGAAEELN